MCYEKCESSADAASGECGAAHDGKEASALVHAAFQKAYETLDRYRDTGRRSARLVRAALNTVMRGTSAKIALAAVGEPLTEVNE